MSADQLGCAFDEAVPVDAGLTCAFGEPWMGLHPLCEARSNEMCRQFAEAVRSGQFAAEGYTPNERKAQARRALERQQATCEME